MKKENSNKSDDIEINIEIDNKEKSGDNDKNIPYSEKQHLVTDPFKKKNVNHQKDNKSRVLTLPIILLLAIALRYAFDADTLFLDIKNFFSVINFIVWGFAIAYFLDPLVTFFINKVFTKTKKKNTRRMLSLVCAYFIFIGIITFLSAFILPVIGQNILDIAANAPTYLKDLQKWWTNTEQALESDNFLNQYLITVGEKINTAIIDFFNSADFTTSLKNLGTGILNTAWGATRAIIDIIFGLVISAYMLSDKEDMIRGLKRLTYALFSKETADRMVVSSNKTNEIVRKFFLGKGAASLIIAVITFIFVSIGKMPTPLLQATLIGITNMIPTIGPFLGAVPCVLLTVFHSPVRAFWLFIYIICIQQIDGIYLSPKILGDSLGLKPLYIIVGVLIGGGLFGLLGAFLGTPAIAVISFFITEYTQKRLKQKNLDI